MSVAVAVFVSGLALAIIVVGTSQIIGPRCGTYKITDDSIEFVLFGSYCVWRCPFNDITDIRLISFIRLLTVVGLNLMNRPFAQYVLVRRRRGMFKAVVITPDQPQEFVRIVQQKVGDAANGG